MDDEAKKLSGKELADYIKKKFGAESIEELDPDLLIPEVGQMIDGLFIESRVDDVDGDERASIILDTPIGIVKIPAGHNLERKCHNLKAGDKIAILRVDDGISKTDRTFKNWKVYKLK